MKYKIIIIAFLFSWNAFSQSEVNGKMKTEIVQKHEMGYALHISVNTKAKKSLMVFLHGFMDDVVNPDYVITILKK